MKRFLIGAALLAAACNSEQTQTTDTADDAKQSIAIEYVKDAQLPIHAKPDDASPVIATYSASSAVSVLSRKGEWVEVRVADGSGWAREAALQGAAEAKANESTSTEPHFVKAPSPVTGPGAHGDITLEADVSPNGEVINVRTITNTTGSNELVVRNTMSLQHARFYPIVQHGQRVPFTYEYRVHY
jgi:hypothetical protein